MTINRLALDVLNDVLATHAVWASGGDGVRADLIGANLIGADLRGADLNSASLSGADLSGADLRRTGAMRVLHGDYEVTLYPGADLSYGCESYGCERHSLAHWREHVEAITARHVHIESLRATKVRELRALFDLCDAIQQPKEPTP